ncbi:MAG: hypothetical protein M2R45_02516 [Verrucomicrobia subdivision 3 bacterium]|nr:hypothetical protein [Limisphaerales bacterium]MCS1414277.1 hypothetical protein [Limisphaerales bacterium]
MLFPRTEFSLAADATASFGQPVSTTIHTDNMVETFQGLFFEPHKDRFLSLNGGPVKKRGIRLQDAISEYLEKANEHFGNGRPVRNCFEQAVNAQANRLASNINPDPDALVNLIEDGLDSPALPNLVKY